MKTLSLLLLLISTTVQAQSLGGQIVSDKKEQGSIYLECVNVQESPCTLAVIVTEVNGLKTVHDRLVVPMGNDFDSYAERWGVFNEIATEASIRMPPVPEARYLLLVNLSMKSYREAFKLLESSEKTSESYKMRSLFLEKLLQVIAL